MEQINPFYSEKISKAFQLYDQGRCIMDLMDQAGRKDLSEYEIAMCIHWFHAAKNELTQKIRDTESIQNTLQQKMEKLLAENDKQLNRMELKKLDFPFHILEPIIHTFHVKTVADLCELSRMQIIETGCMEAFKVDRLIRYLRDLQLALHPDPPPDPQEDDCFIYDDSEEITQKINAIFGTVEE